MLKNVSHSGGVEVVGEVLFNTPFGYMLPDAAASEECLLPVSERTVDALLALGDAMVDVPRDGRAARIGDGRNDENVNISQLYAAFHNKVVDLVGSAPTPA